MNIDFDRIFSDLTNELKKSGESKHVVKFGKDNDLTCAAMIIVENVQEQLDAMDRVWVALQSEEPEIGKPVDLFTRSDERLTNYVPTYDEDGNLVLFESHTGESQRLILPEDVTHWMAVPPAPTKNTLKGDVQWWL